MSMIESLQLSPAASVIISMSLILLSGFLMTRITKLLRLPNVTAYIVAGILMGPFAFNLIPLSFVEQSAFLPDIALSFIAFGTGEFFKLEVLRKSGPKVLVITVMESLVTVVLVFLLMYCILGLSLPFSVVLAALSAATAPASTMMTIRQTHARGDFVDTLLQVVALDDVVGLVAYSVAVSIAESSLSGRGFHIQGLVRPILTNLGVILLGGLFGLFLRGLLSPGRSKDNRLIVSVSLLFGFCGICTWLDISPLLGCMMMGAVYSNLAAEEDKLFKQLNYFSPPILLLFFVRSGISFDLSALFSQSGAIGTVPLLGVGIAYFLTRMAGKYSGAWLGCRMTRKDHKVRNWLGFALFPQAGVAIGLAALGARILGGEAGNALNTVILSSSILYELIGPGCAKLSLYKSGAYSDKLEEMVDISETDENGVPKTNVQLLIERINKIQEELPDHYMREDERAFTEGAEEWYDLYHDHFRTRQNRHY